MSTAGILRNCRHADILCNCRRADIARTSFERFCNIECDEQLEALLEGDYNLRVGVNP